MVSDINIYKQINSSLNKRLEHRVIDINNEYNSLFC